MIIKKLRHYLIINSKVLDILFQQKVLYIWKYFRFWVEHRIKERFNIHPLSIFGLNIG